jgi:hypothetical protein
MIEEWKVKPVTDKPEYFTGDYKDYTADDIEWVARQFAISGAVVIAPFPGRGNINLHTYSVIVGGMEYLLQKVNSDVFTMPYRVMSAMITSINAQWSAVKAGQGADGWEPITLIPTKDGQPFLNLTDEHGWSVWRLMIRIPRSACYKSLSEAIDRDDQLHLAEEVGRGLAIYADLTSSVDSTTVEPSLPGYRDAGLYYRQFHSVMAGNRTLEEAAGLLPQDPIIRSSTQAHFTVALPEGEYLRRKNDPELQPYIELVREQEPLAMCLWKALGDGRIRPTLIHGDTKIENFLFCSATGRVKSLVDLDTIMPFTWLGDWGDMQRSLVNVAGEAERDLSKIVVDEEVFEAVARGFLAMKDVTDGEASMLVPAIQSLALEIGLRFLADYLRGDTYFQLSPDSPPDLNRAKAMNQLTLYRRLTEFAPAAEEILAEIRRCAG